MAAVFKVAVGRDSKKMNYKKDNNKFVRQVNSVIPMTNQDVKRKTV